MSFVVHVKAVFDRVILEIGDESGNVEYGHVSWREYRMPDAVRH
jgi:hypothetical protein